jgi:molybdopterin/thiamine biosynthesis adenylyltransferase
MRPQLKGVAWERLDGDSLRVVYDRREQLIMDDPDGTVQRLLELLREGGRTVAEIAAVLAVGVSDVSDAVAALDEHRLLEDEERRTGLSPEQAERHFSNLAFFESFATLERSREDFQRRLRQAHVLVLGTGGLNSNTLPHLCGLGVGRLTLLDRDSVDVRNFARQYLYRWSEIGERKVERAGAWVRAFDPTIEVTTLDREVGGVEDLERLLERYEPDVVMSGIDTPNEVDKWVNSACVQASVPYVRAGMWVTQGTVWSVDPGRSACLACIHTDAAALAEHDRSLVRELAASALFATKPRANRGIGPVAGIIGAYAAFEVLRYLTGFEPPAYAGAPLCIDFAAHCATERVGWDRNPACPVCGTDARSRRTDGAAEKNVAFSAERR